MNNWHGHGFIVGILVSRGISCFFGLHITVIFVLFESCLSLRASLGLVIMIALLCRTCSMIVVRSDFLKRVVFRNLRNFVLNVFQNLLALGHLVIRNRLGLGLLLRAESSCLCCEETSAGCFKGFGTCEGVLVVLQAAGVAVSTFVAEWHCFAVGGSNIFLANFVEVLFLLRCHAFSRSLGVFH